MNQINQSNNEFPETFVESKLITVAELAQIIHGMQALHPENRPVDWTPWPTDPVPGK